MKLRSIAGAAPLVALTTIAMAEVPDASVEAFQQRIHPSHYQHAAEDVRQFVEAVHNDPEAAARWTDADIENTFGNLNDGLPLFADAARYWFADLPVEAFVTRPYALEYPHAIRRFIPDESFTLSLRATWLEAFAEPSVFDVEKVVRERRVQSLDVVLEYLQHGLPTQSVPEELAAADRLLIAVEKLAADADLAKAIQAMPESREFPWPEGPEKTIVVPTRNPQEKLEAPWVLSAMLTNDLTHAAILFAAAQAWDESRRAEFRQQHGHDDGARRIDESAHQFADLRHELASLLDEWVHDEKTAAYLQAHAPRLLQQTHEELRNGWKPPLLPKDAEPDTTTALHEQLMRHFLTYYRSNLDRYNAILENVVAQ